MVGLMCINGWMDVYKWLIGMLINGWMGVYKWLDECL